MTELENTVSDAYIIYAKTPNEERQQKYATLLQKVEELQQQYGTGKFDCYRRFELIPAVAVIIKDAGIIEALQKEGYVVERQNVIRASQPDSQHF